ncbi:MAG: ribosome recycling factor, partial [Oscillospiraceae bacterium]|nr:ribosome recycling factor [Oscillospiraceae bacterium]
MSDYPEFESKMKKTTEVLSQQLEAVRAGRANAAVLNQISVEYYGVPTPIQQVASVSVPDPRTLMIQPWDASILKGIEKAILASELGINPQNDGRAIRLVFPQLTEERRKELAKQVKKYGEEAKVAVRNIRRDAIDKFKKQQKASEMTEDDYKIAEKDMQKLTDDFT